MSTLPIQARSTTGVGEPQADSECNERIPPDGFDMAALEVTLCGGTPPPASLVPLPFQGSLIHKLANAVQNKVYRLYKQYLKEPTLQIQARVTIGVGKPQADSEERANSAGRFRCGCTRKLLPSGKSAGRCGHRPLHVPRSSSIKSNISGEAIDNRRWQVPGGQRV